MAIVLFFTIRYNNIYPPLKKLRIHRLYITNRSGLITKIAFTLETPGKLDIRFRVNMMVQLVFLSLQILNSKTWMVPIYRNH
jgi:hypothetical protein